MACAPCCPLAIAGGRYERSTLSKMERVREEQDRRGGDEHPRRSTAGEHEAGLARRYSARRDQFAVGDTLTRPLPLDGSSHIRAGDGESPAVQTEPDALAILLY